MWSCGEALSADMWSCGEALSADMWSCGEALSADTQLAAENSCLTYTVCQFLPSHRVHKVQLVDSILSRLNLVQIPTPYNTHMKPILILSLHVFFKRYLFSVYSNYTFVPVSYLSRAIITFFPSVSLVAATTVLPTKLF